MEDVPSTLRQDIVGGHLGYFSNSSQELSLREITRFWNSQHHPDHIREALDKTLQDLQRNILTNIRYA